MTAEEITTVCIKREAQYEDVMRKTLTILKELGHNDAADAVAGMARTYHFLPIPSPHQRGGIKFEDRSMNSTEIYETIVRTMSESHGRLFTLGELQRVMPRPMADGAWHTAIRRVRQNVQIEAVGGARSKTYRWVRLTAVGA